MNEETQKRIDLYVSMMEVGIMPDYNDFLHSSKENQEAILIAGKLVKEAHKLEMFDFLSSLFYPEPEDTRMASFIDRCKRRRGV